MTRERALQLATAAWERLGRDFPTAALSVPPGFAVRVLAGLVKEAALEAAAEEREACARLVTDAGPDDRPQDIAAAIRARANGVAP